VKASLDQLVSQPVDKIYKNRHKTEAFEHSKGTIGLITARVHNIKKKPPFYTYNELLIKYTVVTLQLGNIG